MTNQVLPTAKAVVDYHAQPADLLYRAAIIAGFVVVVWASWHLRVFQGFEEHGFEYGWLGHMVRPSLLWGGIGLLMLLFRTLLWFRYRVPPVASMDAAPSLTVVIPAYNEGAMVARSIDSVATAKYPRERLEIFVIDDGSRDDTWQHIEAAAARHPGLVTTLRFERNQGKRAALEAGFRRARGEVLVTIDSDSVIDADALLAMAGPFRDPAVGAVAGKVSVFNHASGLIPRMLKVRFALSFDFLRAAQSTYGTVYCCPGALAGYRASVVHQVLDGWVNQRFLGRRCTFGEDRALTNEILRAGYHSVYQHAAVVHTLVPVRYTKLCKMFLRWDRSYVREEIRFLYGVVWKRPPAARGIALADVLITNSRYPISLVVLALLALMTIDYPEILLRLACVMTLVAAFNMLYYLRMERSWDFIYGIAYSFFAAFALFWVFPYAVCTARKQGWLTR